MTMITKKRAYLNVLYMENQIKNIMGAIEDNRVISAWRQLDDLEKKRKQLIKPVYSTLSKKQKDELMMGIDADNTTTGASIFEPNPKGWKKAWDKE